MLLEASGTAHAGEVLAVTGENGAGKTTLLRTISGLIRPTAGTVLVHGRTPDERDPAFRRLLAAHIGPPATARDLTLGEHLQFLGVTWGARPAQAREDGQALLESLQLGHLTARFPHELSSGQTQLFHLALVLHRPADVLVLDEPEQRLDPGRLATVAGILRERADAGTTVILATHSAMLREDLADRTVEVEPA